jgi:DNA-binding response OmpR family regulator
VLLTGHATVDTAVAALRHKAANYLLKPVKNEELIAAVAAALHAHQREQRRDQLEQVAVQFSQVLTGTATLMVDSPAPLEYGNLVLHPASYTAYHDTERLNLTLTEFRLLAQFVQSPGVALEYIHLVEAACGYRCSRQEAQEIIGTHIRNVRQKLGIAPNTPLYIEAVRGIGYRLLTLAQE